MTSVCPVALTDASRVTIGAGGSQWPLISLPDSGGTPADKIVEILACIGDADRAALAVYCNALSGYTDALAVLSCPPTALGLAV
ncbi:hypothetical protein GCM10009839_85020 [Catenulispora yoronensis]|uniref:Uncharacterized protein n=1 Tax=Catenulispora yoronensis TaxID=450799 RepID=A0ABN2VFB0_9ACTN